MFYKDYTIRKSHGRYQIYSITGASLTKHGFSNTEEAKKYIDEVIYAR